jgi:hypothetical protein
LSAVLLFFFRISKEVDEDKREFSLGITSLADSGAIGRKIIKIQVTKDTSVGPGDFLPDPQPDPRLDLTCLTQKTANNY